MGPNVSGDGALGEYNDALHRKMKALTERASTHTVTTRRRRQHRGRKPQKHEQGCAAVSVPRGDGSVRRGTRG